MSNLAKNLPALTPGLVTALILNVVGLENAKLPARPEICVYRAPGKSMYFLLSRTQAGPGRTVKQEQEEISRNHVQTFSGCSVHLPYVS